MSNLEQFRSRYGQGAARSILQVLGRTLRNAVWPTDVVGTWSDNQFLAILMGCSEEAMHAVGGRMQKMLSGATINWWGEELSVAVSLGFTGARPGDSMESILLRARESVSGAKTANLPEAALAAVSSAKGSSR